VIEELRESDLLLAAGMDALDSTEAAAQLVLCDRILIIGIKNILKKVTKQNEKDNDF